MKRFLKLIFLILFPFILFENIYSQIPKYSLHAKNFVIVNPCRITFDIVLAHTDANAFEYSVGQFFFRVPQSFGTLGVGSGASSGFQFDSIDGQPISEFPVNFRPRNPSVVTTIVNDVPSYELRLAANVLPGTGNGLILPPLVPKLVIRMKLVSSDPFNVTNMDMFFRDSCSESPVSLTRTKINAYLGTLNTEITRCAHHYVNYSLNLPIISCNIKLALEGYFNLNENRLNRSETVTAYLRSTASPYLYVDSTTAKVDSNTLTGNFFFSGITPSGTYYIVVKHRNSLETWSKTGGENLIRGNNNYDFTTSASQAYGDNIVLKGNKYCIYGGNVNDDKLIDIDDLLLIDNDLFNFASGSLVTDLNGDNLVDLVDMAIVDMNASNLILVQWPGVTFDENIKQFLHSNPK